MPAEEAAMPIVRIDIQSGKSTHYKRTLLHGVRQAITGALGVPESRIMQRIIESPAEDIDAPGRQTDRLTIVDITMLPGRDSELKRNLYEEVVSRLRIEPGIEPTDIMVVVHDPPAECFCLGGEVPSG
jgi:phenylpyruvate tautomerase PptA (4-oxalocrotonate tautomerase family)